MARFIGLHADEQAQLEVEGRMNEELASYQASIAPLISNLAEIEEMIWIDELETYAKDHNDEQ